MSGDSGRGCAPGVPEIRLERSFPRQIAALDSLVGFVGEFLQASGLDAEDPFEIELILEELFTNLVKYNRGGIQPIQIALHRRGDVVEMRLRDFDVEPYDVTQAPAADPQGRVAAGRSGGLGLHLVRRLSESLTYDYSDRVSTITATRRLGR